MFNERKLTLNIIRHHIIYFINCWGYFHLFYENEDAFVGVLLSINKHAGDIFLKA